MIAGVLMVAEGYRERPLSRLYGTAMMTIGSVYAAAVLMILGGLSVPLAIVLFILAAVVTVVVSWFAPDDVQRWLDKVMHFGKNASGVFPDSEAQREALCAMQEVQ